MRALVLLVGAIVLLIAIIAVIHQAVRDRRRRRARHDPRWEVFIDHENGAVVVVGIRLVARYRDWREILFKDTTVTRIPLDDTTGLADARSLAAIRAAQLNAIREDP